MKLQNDAIQLEEEPFDLAITTRGIVEMLRPKAESKGLSLLYSIQRDRFDAVKQTMAEQALASGSPGNNPRVPSVTEMVQIYDSLWKS